MASAVLLSAWVGAGCASSPPPGKRLGAIGNGASARYGYGPDAVFDVACEPCELIVTAPVRPPAGAVARGAAEDEIQSAVSRTPTDSTAAGAESHDSIGMSADGAYDAPRKGAVSEPLPPKRESAAATRDGTHAEGSRESAAERATTDAQEAWAERKQRTSESSALGDVRAVRVKSEIAEARVVATEALPLVLKTVVPAEARAGDTVVFSIVLKNVTPLDIRTAEIVDVLDPALRPRLERVRIKGHPAVDVEVDGRRLRVALAAGVPRGRKVVVRVPCAVEAPADAP